MSHIVTALNKLIDFEEVNKNFNHSEKSLTHLLYTVSAKFMSVIFVKDKYKNRKKIMQIMSVYYTTLLSECLHKHFQTLNCIKGHVWTPLLP